MRAEQRVRILFWLLGFDEVLEKLLKTVCSVSARKIIQVMYLEDLIESSLHWLPRGDWLCAVWYPGEIEWPGYHTPGRFQLNFNKWLTGVWCPGEIYSAQYDTQGDCLCTVWYPKEIDSAQ